MKHTTVADVDLAALRENFRAVSHLTRTELPAAGVAARPGILAGQVSISDMHEQSGNG